MKEARILLAGLVSLLGFLDTASGQILPITIGPSVTKFLSQTNAFTAEADLYQGGGLMAVRFFYDHGKTRAEMDLSRLVATDAIIKETMDESFREMMRKVGTDLAVTIFNPVKKSAYLIYPKLKSYAEVRLGAEAAKELENIPKPESAVELGHETISGHPCIKNKVTFAEEREFERQEIWGLRPEKTEGFVWNAVDEHGLPMKFDGYVNSGKLTLILKEMKPGKTETKLYEPPSGYRKFDSLEALMQAKVRFPDRK